tara:strand:+ start:257 stop:523 length:267 start_codon:yes stop_codon:yes gene_type:complete
MAEIYDTFGKKHAMPDKKPDKINPPYYQKTIEVTDFIIAYALDFLEGNIVKYITRYKDKHKDGLEDLYKCRWYLDKLIEEKEREQNNG